jgi:hypothetical protein
MHKDQEAISAIHKFRDPQLEVAREPQVMVLVVQKDFVVLRFNVRSDKCTNRATNQSAEPALVSRRCKLFEAAVVGETKGLSRCERGGFV